MTMTKTGVTLLASVLALGVVAASSLPVAGEDAATFYKNHRDMKMIISAGPGGSYDIYARLLVRHIGRHIPGNPSIVPMNVPGASGIKAANYVAQQAPHDGTILTNVRYNFAMYQALDNLKAVKTDMRSFHWIGSYNATNHVLVTFHTAPVKTFAEAQKTQVLIGQASPRSFGTLMCRIYNALLDTKLKVITGYGDIAKVKLAMKRGEVQGVGDDGWTDLKADFAELLRDKQLNILIQVGLKKEPELPDVPLLLDMAKNAEQKALFDFVTKSDASMGKPFATSPGVPADRVTLLRRAFDATMTDPGFLKDAKRLQVEIRPIAGEDVQKIVADIMGAPKDVTSRMRAALGIK